MPELHETPPRCEFDVDEVVIKLDEVVRWAGFLSADRVAWKER